jgi:hypothetical protein
MPPTRPNPRKRANSSDGTSGRSRLRGPDGPWRAGGHLLALVLVVAAIALLSGRVGADSGADGHSSPTNRVVVGGSSNGGPQAGFTTYSGSITDGSTIIAMYDSLMHSAGQVVSVNLSITKPTAADLKSSPKVVQLDSNCNASPPPANCKLVLGQTGIRFKIANAGAVAGANVTYSNGVYYVTGLYQLGNPTLDSKGYFLVPISAVNPPSATGAGDADDHA